MPGDRFGIAELTFEPNAATTLRLHDKVRVGRADDRARAADAIDQPPAVLGKMIGGALVGTFLGVLLAYGLMGPLAARLKGVVEEEAKYLEVIRAVVVAHLHGNAPQVAVETGRKMAPSHSMPSFQELEESLQNLTI